VENTPLGSQDVAIAGAYLRWLVESEHRYSEALGLARRLDSCRLNPGVPARFLREVRRDLIDLSRHLGYYAEADNLAREEGERARQPVTGNYDEQAQADVVRAAALYDPHLFEEMDSLLSPWLLRLEEDSRIVLPETRIMVLNTLARARVILGRPDWEAMFRKSLEILRQRDPTDAARTRNFLAHALLRNRRTDEAGVLLDELDRDIDRSEMSRWMLRFYQAEHARQSGKCHTDPEMEDSPRKNGNRLGHPFGFYFQATARQPGQSPQHAARRFSTARDFFLRDAQERGRRTILTFLASCMLLGEAAWLGDTGLWHQARKCLADELRPHDSCLLMEHYSAQWSRLGTAPDRAAADAFLSHVPFF
jgi:hypothetical protein